MFSHIDYEEERRKALDYEVTREHDLKTQQSFEEALARPSSPWAWKIIIFLIALIFLIRVTKDITVFFQSFF
jgi:hypothetical protein